MGASKMQKRTMMQNAMQANDWHKKRIAGK